MNSFSGAFQWYIEYAMRVRQGNLSQPNEAWFRARQEIYWNAMAQHERVAAERIERVLDGLTKEANSGR